MAKEICISSTPHETRLAILEDDQLAEIYYERENEYTLAGSIYNGKVTRVLPGMQSAFVDLGLERDAFLYVTDFIELEDQEEADELEKAAAGGQPPREIQHRGHEQNAGRQEERSPRPGQRAEPSQSTNGERRPGAYRRPDETSAEASVPATHEQQGTAGPTESAREGDEPAGGRWRGRRRRRGGRGMGTETESPRGAGSAGEAGADSAGRPAYAEETISTVPAEPTAPRAHRAAEPTLLPGESLSKYGGTPPVESKTRNVPVRPASTSKPSTLIESPLQWDGSGLLPGESISRHREREAEPTVTPASEPQAGSDAEPVGKSVHEEFAEEMEELTPPAVHEIAMASLHEPPFEFEEESIEASRDEAFSDEELPSVEAAGNENDVPGETASDQSSASEADSEDADASASHRVDPSAPTGFRLFGFGGKKKESASAETATIAPAAPVSRYAPGAGPVEEEVIEGEEFDAAPHSRRKPEAHDPDEYEEETLPTHLRSGDLGEMLQEAHLDHRIQLNFEDKGVEEEEFDTAEEEEEAGAETQTQPGQDRRPRSGRGQRGRGPQGNRRGPARRSAQTSDLPIISDLLKSGQEILVQIAKEPIAKKGARITSHIALPGRFLVFMPTVSHVGVSRKIDSDEERHRLKRVLTHERGDASGGFIVRTAAEGASEEELRADLRFLMNLWNEIKQRSESLKSPALIYRDLSLIERILRDQVSSNFASIWVDTQEDYERIVKFLNRFSPSLVRRVKLYTKETPLFEHFGIQDEIAKAMRSKVWLKSGGSIVINQTEALVAIDINTGKYVGKSARLEDTILKTNLDAVPEIVRQIRLRDLGGIIVIDFIDMDERKNRFKVMAALEEALKSDRAPTKVLQFNDFGLVAITRKRVKQSLERTLSVPCPTCQSTGMVKSPTTVCNEIYIEMRKMRKHFENADVMLRVNPETVKILKANGNRWLSDFEELIGKNVLVKSDPALHPEQFDIQG